MPNITVSGLVKTKMQEIFASCDAAQPGRGDYITDHRKHDNPYLSLYGESKWEEEMATSFYMRRHMSIKELWLALVERADAVMKGTPHETRWRADGKRQDEDWYIDHDALIQLTNKETIKWMQNTKGPGNVLLYDRWLLPLEELNAGTNFDGRPVGNNPHAMPWDASLNKDVDDCVRYQVILTQHINKNDPRKFCCATPKLQDAAYRRVMDPVHGPLCGAPLGKRMETDFGKCYGENLVITCIAEGWAVHGCGNRNGHRNHDSYYGPEDVRERMLLHMKGRGQHGGLRVAQTEPKEKKWRHPDAEKVYQGKTEKDKFFFKAEVDLLPRAGLPMWCSRSTREHWR